MYVIFIQIYLVCIGETLRARNTAKAEGELRSKDFLCKGERGFPEIENLIGQEPRACWGGGGVCGKGGSMVI